VHTGKRVFVPYSNTDLIAYVPRMPARGETITGSAFQSGFGGKGANQCAIAAKLGARVAMVGAVGSDSFGRDTVANFARMGVDTSRLKV
jgi:ribokinase